MSSDSSPAPSQSSQEESKELDGDAGDDEHKKAAPANTAANAWHPLQQFLESCSKQFGKVSDEAAAMEMMMVKHPVDCLTQYTTLQQAGELCAVAQRWQRRDNTMATQMFVLQALSVTHALVIFVVTTTMEPDGFWPPGEQGKQAVPGPALLRHPDSSGLRGIIQRGGMETNTACCVTLAAYTRSRACSYRSALCPYAVCVCVRGGDSGILLQPFLESRFRRRSVHGNDTARGK